MRNCPHCKRQVSKIVLEPISLEGRSFGSSLNLNGVAYLCPICGSILSVGVDPASMKADLVAEILRHIEKA